MPPGKRITKEDIITAAFNLVRSEGIAALNARNVAKSLNCSTQPIFSEFQSMDRLKQEIVQRAGMYYLNYLNRLTATDDYLFSFGMTFIEFSLNERNLYQLIFMSGQLNEFKILEICDENIAHVNHIARQYQLNRPNAEKVFIQLTLYIQGIASVLYANNDAFRADGEIREYLKEACTGFLMTYREETL